MYTERHSSLLPYVFTVRTLRSNGQSLHRKSHPSWKLPRRLKTDTSQLQHKKPLISSQPVLDWLTSSAMDSCFDLRFLLLLLLFSWQWSMCSYFCLRLRTLAAKQWMALSVEATGISTFQKRRFSIFIFKSLQGSRWANASSGTLGWRSDSGWWFSSNGSKSKNLKQALHGSWSFGIFLDWR